MAAKWKAAALKGGPQASNDDGASPSSGAFGASLSSPTAPSRPQSASGGPRRMIDRASSFLSSFNVSRAASRMDDEDDAARERQFIMADDPTMRARWDVVDLRTLAMVTCFVSILVTGAIPLAEQFIWYKYDARLTEITVANWVVAGCAGILGLIAAYSKRAYMVGFHVIIGGMLGAAIGLYSVIVYYDMRVRCEIMQAAYVGCSGCTCSLQNRCTKDDLLVEECARCAAWPTEVCAAVNPFALTSLMGLVAVIACSFPVAVNLILLLRMEAQTGEHFKTMKGLDTAELEHQMELLTVGAEPTARPTSINLLIDRVRDHGDTRLAEKAHAALNVYRAVRKGPPEGKTTLKSLAARATGPKMLNIAALAAQQANMEAEESVGGDGLSTTGSRMTVHSAAGPQGAEVARVKSAPNTNNKLAGILKKTLSRSKSAKAPSVSAAADAAAAAIAAEEGQKPMARFRKTMSLGRRASAPTTDVEMATGTSIEILKSDYEDEDEPAARPKSRPLSRPPSAFPSRRNTMSEGMVPPDLGESSGVARSEVAAEFSRFEVPIDRGISSFDVDGMGIYDDDDDHGLGAAVSTFELED